MNVLVCGASGFIGKAISDQLSAAGHTVIKGVRQPNGPNEIAIDFTRDHSIEAWSPRLQGIDAVINAVGILVEGSSKTFAALHDRAPRAMFAACAKAGVNRVVQISALGAEHGDTPYFISKRTGDEYLASQPIGWHIVRPALVYGREGTSARLFRFLASLPVIGLPAGGKQLVQPIHINDLTELVSRLLDPSTPTHQCVEAVGGRALGFRDMLRCYRQAMSIAPALEIPIPRIVMELAANVIGLLPGSMFNPDTWRMLQAGNTGDTKTMTHLLGRPPRSIDDFILPTDALALRQQSFAAWRGTLLRASLAFVWIATGLASLFLYPKSESSAMLAKVGLEGAYAQVSLYGAAILDVTFGVATFIRPCRVLWVAQMALIVSYTAIIAISAPEYLIHPFGPITKNIPILAILVLLYAENAQS